MDLLASLHLDALPEQQTRTAKASVTEALQKNPDVKLGFNACLNCGMPQPVSVPSVTCKGCDRVSYCSHKCRKEDANPPEEEVEATQQLGHGSIVCALLRLCNKDEDVDEGGDAATNLKDKDANDARDRVRSEYESYVATLANVLMSGPCFEDILTRKSRKTLTVHIVGASEGVELWGDRPSMAGDEVSNPFDAYGEALTDLAEMNKLEKIHLIFVGPDCPKNTILETRKMSGFDQDGNTKKKGKSPTLLVETHRSNYDARYLKKGTKDNVAPPVADIVVFFNPGFTCPDYEWTAALSCIKAGTPFLVTTNTEMEGVADCQYLFKNKKIPALPPSIADIIEGGVGDIRENEEDEGDEGLFFGENPFAGQRIRQSGNMANDLFVKNRWMFGGIFGMNKKTASPKRKSREPEEQTDKKKKRKKGNSKKSNPALI